MRSRKGIGLELVGIVSVLIVFLIWLAISSSANSGRLQNFGNWLDTSDGQFFSALISLAIVLVVLYLVIRVVRFLVNTEDAPPPETPDDEPEVTPPAWPDDNEDGRV